MNPEMSLIGGVLSQITVTDTSGEIIVPTYGRAIVVFEIENAGSVALSECSLYRRAFPGMTWELLCDTAADYAVADPQLKAFAVTAEDSDTFLDPLTLAPADKVKIYAPADGNQHVMLVPRVAADSTTLNCAYGCGD